LKWHSTMWQTMSARPDPRSLRAGVAADAANTAAARVPEIAGAHELSQEFQSTRHAVVPGPVSSGGGSDGGDVEVVHAQQQGLGIARPPAPNAMPLHSVREHALQAPRPGRRP
jgi:hypothetical protein